MIVTFVGHADIVVSEKTKKQIRDFLTEIIHSETNLLFYCGGYGFFDSFCAGVCRELKALNNNVKTAFITPYMTLEYQQKNKLLLENGSYDYIIYPPIEKTPLKFAISKRNEWMIQESDLVVAFVERTYGGAYKSLLYAKRKQKKIVNFAKE